MTAPAANTPRWTPDQQRAIQARGADVLVSASAGTGKTAVLSNRCVSLLMDNANPVDVTDILVLTFTDAAAEEMRARIHAELRRALHREKHPRLRAQLLMLDSACISTIHSFCKRLITEHFYLLDLDPGFRLLDADEQLLLRFQILESTLENAWQDSSLVESLNELLRGRNLTAGSFGYLENILTVSRFLESVPDAPQWYDRIHTLTDLAAAARLEAAQAESLENNLDRLSRQIELMLEMDARCIAGHWHDQIQAELAAPLIACRNALGKKDYALCREIIEGFKPAAFRKPKDADPDAVERVKYQIDTFKLRFRALASRAVFNPDYIEHLAPHASLQSRTLLELVRRFERDYAAAKQRLSSLDFSDLQRLALRLLSENPDLAQTLRARFKYIFLDEVQDINAIQQRIIERIASGDNAFLVGDVKQCIYAFRQANPRLFLERIHAAGRDRSTLVALTDNFRSHPDVLDFANAVFSRVMTEAFTGLTYDDTAHLRPGLDVYTGAEEAQTPSPRIELHLFDEEESAGDADGDQDDTHTDEDTSGDDAQSPGQISDAQRQAVFIAERIKKMLSEKELRVFDKSARAFRDLEYRDIVILMRSPSTYAGDYVQVLQQAGIPVDTAGAAGFFAATEITDCVTLLRVLDNPRQDIELAALLRSPFFGFTDTDLARIRLFARSRDRENTPPYHACVMLYAREGDDADLRDRLSEALARIDAWRTAARHGSLSELFWSILRESGYLAFVTALPHGRRRRANLLKLHDRAIQFENFADPSRSGSLTRFVDFLEKLRLREQDWAPAESDAVENAVRVLSVHKSKGLEFPVVFLAQLGQPFNLTGSTGPVLLDEDFGMGLRLIDPATRASAPDLLHEIIADARRGLDLAEEMRILYVAVTRAREKLILTGSVRSATARRIVAEVAVRPDRPAEDFQLRACRSPILWLLYALAPHEPLRRLFADIPFPETAPPMPAPDFSAAFVDTAALDEPARAILYPERSRLDASALPPDDPDLARRVHQALDWRYPCESAITAHAKMSVTQYTHRGDEFLRLAAPAPSAPGPRALDADRTTRISAAQVGTAAHLLIQNLDLSAPVTLAALEKTLARLVDSHQIDPDAAGRVNLQSVLDFFETDLGRSTLNPAHRVLREWPFTFALPLPEADDFRIIQGIIDMLILTPKGHTIVDFKTDRVTADTAPQKAEHYREQIRLYSLAAESILKTKTLGGYLYFLSPALTVKV